MQIIHETIRSTGAIGADQSSVSSADHRLKNQRGTLLRYLVKLNTALQDDCHDLADSVCMRFSETLVDYLFQAHFQVYPDSRLAAGGGRALSVIANTTETAMAFNDRFGQAELALSTDHAQRERLARHDALERLALALETRFELEDDLLFNTVH